MEHGHTHHSHAHIEHAGGVTPSLNRSASSTVSLPDRLCDRRGARHDHRHRPRLGQRCNYCACRGPGILLRLPAHAAAAARPMSFPAAAKLALAADTASITVMEIVDNAIMLVIPGAMTAGLSSPLFWGSLAFSLAVAAVAAFPSEPLADLARQGPRGRPCASSLRQRQMFHERYSDRQEIRRAEALPWIGFKATGVTMPDDA